MYFPLEVALNKITTIKGYWETRRVCIDGVELSPAESQRIKNHSPDGFAWAYGGSGPSQLALAILLLFLPMGKAIAFYQDFKWDVIAALPASDFELKGEAVTKWIENHLKAAIHS